MFNAANEVCLTAPAGVTGGDCGSPPFGATVFSYDQRGRRFAEDTPNTAGSRLYGYDDADRLSIVGQVPEGADAGKYRPLAPAKLLDTTDGTDQCAPSPCSRLAPSVVTEVGVTGQAAVPGENVAAVELQMTVINPGARSNIKLNPTSSGQASATTLHFVAGQNPSTSVVAPVDAQGRVRLVSPVAVDVVLTVAGWFAAADGSPQNALTALAPARVADTRDGTGSCVPSPCDQIGAGDTAKVKVTGQGGVPTSGVKAVEVSLITRDPAAAVGYVQLNPTGGVGSTFSWSGSDPTGGAAIAEVDDQGYVSVSTTAAVDVVLDVNGWFGPGANATLETVTPERLADTLAGTGDCAPSPCGPIPAGDQVEVQVAGRFGVPADAEAVALNLAALGGFTETAIKANPNGAAAATTLDLNVLEYRTSTVIVALDAQGRVAFAADPAGAAHVTVDLVGIFTDTAPSEVVAYGYDGDGLRTSRTHDGATTTYVWDHSGPIPMLLAETTGGQTTRYVYGPDQMPIAQILPDGTRQNLHRDQIGSIIAITNTAGQAVGTFAYDPYGQRSATTGSATSNLGYAGEHTDPTTELIYLRARWYDPATGQFLTQDPLLGTTEQPYAYANNNPANNIDPTGLAPWDGWGICITFWDCPSSDDDKREQLGEALGETERDFLQGYVEGCVESAVDASLESDPSEFARQLQRLKQAANVLDALDRAQACLESAPAQECGAHLIVDLVILPLQVPIIDPSGMLIDELKDVGSCSAEALDTAARGLGGDVAAGPEDLEGCFGL